MKIGENWIFLTHYYVKSHVSTDEIGFYLDFVLENCEILKKPVFWCGKWVKNGYKSETTQNLVKWITPINLKSQNL